MGPSERREHDRITYFTEAWLDGLDVGRIPCRLSDISVGGAFLDARTTLPVGTRARLRFRLDEQEIEVVAEVRYSAPGFGMGLRFLDLTENDRRVIQSFVTNRK